MIRVSKKHLHEMVHSIVDSSLRLRRLRPSDTLIFNPGSSKMASGREREFRCEWGTCRLVNVISESLAPASQDAIVALCTLGKLDEASARQLVYLMRRILRPGGPLVVIEEMPQRLFFEQQKAQSAADHWASLERILNAEHFHRCKCALFRVDEREPNTLEGEWTLVPGKYRLSLFQSEDFRSFAGVH